MFFVNFCKSKKTMSDKKISHYIYADDCSTILHNHFKIGIRGS